MKNRSKLSSQAMHSIAVVLMTALIFASLSLTSCGGDDDSLSVVTFNDVQDVKDYLMGTSGGTKAAAPLRLKLILDLGNMPNMGSGWYNLLDALSNKYVELDLSLCTMTGEVFNPGSSITGGKDRIVSLVLPNVATSITSGTDTTSAFSYFDELKSIRGAKLEIIGDFAFYKCESLSSVTFPKAKTINISAFSSCTGLKSVNMPQAETIGTHAFSDCSSLKSVNFPLAKTIGENAFYYCSGLSKVSFPLAETIGENAFSFCTGLKSASFTLAKTIGTNAFINCASLSSVSFPLAETIGIGVFDNTGGAALTITLGAYAPTLGIAMFFNAPPKIVTVKIPSIATGYSPFTGTSVTVSGSDSSVNWANGLRGGGWNGSAFTDSSKINDDITVRIERK